MRANTFEWSTLIMRKIKLTKAINLIYPKPKNDQLRTKCERWSVKVKLGKSWKAQHVLILKWSLVIQCGDKYYLWNTIIFELSVEVLRIIKVRVRLPNEGCLSIKCLYDNKWKQYGTYINTQKVSLPGVKKVWIPYSWI